jgi:ssDNA-binding Zn-finger/Zn-ribbon topoisomerase 1
MSATPGNPQIEGAPGDHPAPLCRETGHGYMVVRRNKSNGQKFFGCRLYPDCTVTRSYDDWARSYDPDFEE